MPSKPTMHWSFHLWPGLVQLWSRGSWAGLALAVGFTALANTLVAATFVYRQWMSDGARFVALGVLAVIWLVAWLESRADWRRYLAELAVAAGADESHAADPQEQNDKLFRQAQRRYLAGDWVAAEQLLAALLKRDSRDAEGRLLLATLLRHRGRPQDARDQLDRLERLEAADKWRREIETERSELDRMTSAGDGNSAGEKIAINENTPDARSAA